MPHRSKLTCALVTGLLLTACENPDRRAGPVPVEPVAEEAAVVEAAPLKTPRATAAGNPRAGVVTAGDIDDTLNLAAFARYQARTAKQVKLPIANLSRPVLAQLRNPDGSGAAGVAFTLRSNGAADPFYTGVSGVDGEVAVFPAAMGAGRPSQVEMRVIPDGAQRAASLTLRAGERQVYTLPSPQAWQPDFLDLAFVVDTTGSMADELAWLTKDLKRLVREARRAAPGVDLRFGLVVYRDDGDAYVVRNYGFTKSQSQMQRWLRAQDANGGGDYPEAADRALMAAAGLDWRRGRGERLVIHVADAPAHDTRAKAYLQAAAQAAGKGVQVFTLGASGVGAEAEFLMRQASVVTGGRYMFLTDDSGVGYGHAEPSVACYRVTALSDLVSRMLRSELTGIRVEAQPQEVVREVGSYRRGRCIG